MDHGAAHPRVRQFIGCYLNQDWTIDAEERGDAVHPDSAILDAFKDYEPASLLAIKKEIKALLARNYNDEQLTNVIQKEFHGSVRPSARGSSMHEWLEHVCQMIDAAAIGPSKRADIVIPQG